MPRNGTHEDRERHAVCRVAVGPTNAAAGARERVSITAAGTSVSIEAVRRGGRGGHGNCGCDPRGRGSTRTIPSQGVGLLRKNARSAASNPPRDHRPRRHPRGAATVTSTSTTAVGRTRRAALAAARRRPNTSDAAATTVPIAHHAVADTPGATPARRTICQRPVRARWRVPSTPEVAGRRSRSSPPAPARAVSNQQHGASAG
jgi:hypothetical protein